MKKYFVKTVSGLLTAAFVLTFSAFIPQKVQADDFSYNDFLTQVLVPTYGFSPIGTTKKTMTDIQQRNWDTRSGIITISQLDFNADGVNDCLVYRISASPEGLDVSHGEQIWMDLYTHDAAGTINLVNSVQIGSSLDSDFYRLRVGLMSKQGQIFILVEGSSTAYWVGGYGATHMYWYGFDGMSLRPYYKIDVSSMGSEGYVYSFLEYSDAENYTTTPLWADEYAAQTGTQALYSSPDYPINGILAGLQMIGLPEPGKEQYPNGSASLYPDATDMFPTYFNSQILKKVFEYDVNGEMRDYTTYDMSATLSDYTGINTNQVQPAVDSTTINGSMGTSQNAVDSTTINGSMGTSQSTMSYGTGTALPDGTAATAQTAQGIQTAQAGQPAQPAQTVQQDYIIPDSNSRYLSSADIANLTAQQLNYARNEIYARHGRMFNSVELQQYFASRSWYNPTVSAAAFNDSVFNDYERQNVQLLLAREEAVTGRSGGMLLDQPGYDINAVWR